MLSIHSYVIILAVSLLGLRNPYELPENVANHFDAITRIVIVNMIVYDYSWYCVGRLYRLGVFIKQKWAR